MIDLNKTCRIWSRSRSRKSTWPRSECLATSKQLPPSHTHRLQDLKATVSYRDTPPSHNYEIDAKRQEDVPASATEDLVDEQEPPLTDQRRNATRTEPFFSLLKSFFGIGILATPSAFSKVGVIAAILGILVIGFLNEYSMRLLARLG